MKYNIRPLPNGRCVIAGNHAFYRGNPDERYTYMLFLWLIEGGERPMLIDAGLKNVDEINRGAAHILAEPITQTPEQAAVAQLDKYGYKPEDISYVFITHLHSDHYDYFDLFPNARFVVNKRGFTESLMGIRSKLSGWDAILYAVRLWQWIQHRQRLYLQVMWSKSIGTLRKIFLSGGPNLNPVLKLWRR